MAMSKTRKIVLIITGIVMVVVFAFLICIALVVSALRGNRPSIRDNTVLVLRVAGPLPDYVPDDPIRRLLGGQPQSLSSLLAQFRKAKVDKRITAVLVEIDMPDSGWAKAEEIRGAIADFRTSGKPVYAYMETGLNKDYYIASACDKIFLPPPGELFTIGLAADVMFFRGSLDKLGIYPEIYQIGKYKSVGDMFTQKEMTEAHREFMNSLLDDLYGRFVDGLAKSRNKSPEEIKGLIDNAPYSAAQAKDAGLIDGVAYHDDVEKELKKRLGYKEDDELHIAKAGDYRQISQESLGLNKGEKIAIVYAAGDIVSGRSEFGGSGEETIGSDSLTKTLQEVRDDKTIKAIVLRIDSPGGSGLASDIIWNAIESVKEKKPVVVSMSDVAASGGYYIACNANKIVAEPSTITGSIGVVAGKPVVKGLYDWLGISNEYVIRGQNAGMFRETEKFSDSERQKFEDWIKDTYYNQFLPKVAKGRGKSNEDIDKVGQGRVWTGQQGKDRGLVDEYGGLDKALEIAKQLAKIPADKSIQRVILPKAPSFFEQLLNSGDDDTSEARVKTQQQQAIEAALPEDTRRAFRYLKLLERARTGDVMYRLPFDLRIR
jgi:protease IV